MAHTLDSQLLQHLHLVVTQRAGRSNHDGLTRMNAQRIEVLHRGNREAVVVGIADNLELYLLPALQALLDQYLRSKGECTLGNLLERLFVRTHARTQTAQCISTAYHNRVTYAASSGNGILHSLASLRNRNLQVHLLQLLDKQVAVLGVHDSLNARAKHLDPVFLQRTVQIQLRTAVQCRLTAECQQYAVRTFLLYNFCYKKGIDREEINLICNTFTCLDCRYIRID